MTVEGVKARWGNPAKRPFSYPLKNLAKLPIQWVANWELQWAHAMGGVPEAVLTPASVQCTCLCGSITEKAISWVWPVFQLLSMVCGKKKCR